MPRSNGLDWAVEHYLFNGNTSDLQRNNTQGTLLASAPRVSNTSSPQQTNYNARGVIITLNITAAPNTADTIAIWVRVFDPVANSSNNGVLASLATAQGSTIQSGSLYRLIVYPGASATISNMGIVSSPLPRLWDCYISHGAGTGAFTYSLGYSYIL